MNIVLFLSSSLIFPHLFLLLVIQLSFFIMAAHFSFTTPLHPRRLPPRFSLTIPLPSRLPPSLHRQPASEPALSAESTMAGPFCRRSHALLISLSFSVDGIRRQVHGALYCSSVNQGPCLKSHKLPAKRPVC